MADPIGEIPVQITGDFSFLQKALQEAQNIAAAGAQSISGAINNAFSSLEENGQNIALWLTHPMAMAQESVGGLVNALGPLGLVATAAASAVATIGGAIGHLVLEAGEAVEKTSNFADQLNLSFNEMRQLSDMADIAGVNVGGLARVSMMLADALEDSEGRGKKVANALKDLGITATDSGQALLEVLQKLSEIPDATERIAKAHEIMGRSAIALEPLIKDYAGLKASIEELGGALSKEAIDKLKAADDAADKLSKSWRNFKEEIAITFSPPVIAGLNLLSNLLSKGPQMSVLEHSWSGMAAEISKVSSATEEATKRSKEYNAELDASNKFQLTAARDMAKNADEAFKRSEEYNKELDKSNEAGKKAAETAQKHAAAIAKEAEAYRVLQLSFNGVSEKLSAIRAIKFEQSLFPDSWFKEQKDMLNLLDKLRQEMDKVQDAARATRSLKFLPIDTKAIISLGDAFDILGKNSSEALSEGLTKDINAFNEAVKSSLISTHDLDVILNKILADKLKLAEAGAGTKDLMERLSLEIKIAEVTGASATSQIEQLENVRQHTEALMISTHALGDVYIGLNKAFLDVFDNLDKGLTRLITSGGSIGDTLKGILKSFEQDVVGTFVHGFTEGLKKSFIESGVGQAISGFLTDIFKKVFGGLFELGGKAITAAPQIAATTANTTAISANTAAVTALTSALSAQSAASTAAGATGGAGGGLGALGGVGGAVTAISSAVSAISDVIANFQFSHMNKKLGEIEISTRGALNQLISLQGTFNTYLPQIADRSLGIWQELINVVEILRLMGQVSGGGSASLGQQIADAINSNPHQTDEGVSDGFSELSEKLQDSVTAANDYNAALQTTASTAYELDSAVSTTTSSLYALNEATKQVNGALPAFTEGMDRAVFNSMAGQQGQPGQNLSPGGPRMNATPFIMPVPVPDALTGPGGLMQGSMLPHQNTVNQYSTIAPVVGGPGVSRGSMATVNVLAVDPTSRSITKGIVTGLEEVGIRVR